MRVLQIGKNDWSTSYSIPPEILWMSINPGQDVIDLSHIDVFDVVIIHISCSEELLSYLEPFMNPHRIVMDKLYYDDSSSASDRIKQEEFFHKWMVRIVPLSNPQAFIDSIPYTYFTEQFGSKLPIRKLLFSPLIRERVWFEGTKYLSTFITEMETFQQVFFWKLNINYDHNHPLDLWLEYEIEEGCEIALDLHLVPLDQPEVIRLKRRYNQTELQEPLYFDHTESGYLVASIYARGEGLLRIGALHYRHARREVGHFLPGGIRLVDSNRQELFAYYHPGNLKPPLNIYFSGYRPAEGFEGYYMMKSMEHPFLLFTDPRFEGGAFYLGSSELEQQVHNVIQSTMSRLHFREQDLIFSGLSMGTMAALYYGSRYQAYAIIVGKPILDLLYVAYQTPLVRPYEFLTILDIVKYWDKADEEGAEIPIGTFTKDLLDSWREATVFQQTKIAVAHMLDDDYDDQAYYRLLESQLGKDTVIYSRAYQGRHNDQTDKIVNWFVQQYRRLIKEYI